MTELWGNYKRNALFDQAGFPDSSWKNGNLVAYWGILSTQH